MTGHGALNLEPNLVAPDEFYEALVDTHRDLDEAQSALLNAKLILLLANHIGDARVLSEALAAARENIDISSDAAPAGTSATPGSAQ
ncbi:MAG: DUF2783 domain-containing protein [Betaproteobacteria bacterium]